MNYLAHVYLSGENIDLAIGNFIADYVKGNYYKKLNINWQKGHILILIIFFENIQNYSLTHTGTTVEF